ncbi:AAA family ATPase [Dyella marensis]
MGGVAALAQSVPACGSGGVKRFGAALVVGKFCPLHRGHQYLLDRAQAACEQLVIVSYTRPEFPGCEPERRERWLAALYPRATRLVVDDARLAAHGVALPPNEASDEEHRAFVAWLLREVLRVDVEAVFTSEAYGDGFAASLSRAQGERGGPAVMHVCVDAARTAIPVSGTAVRADVHRARASLDPLVYGDFVRRVAILGGESTGKSTLAAQLANALGTVHAAEYGRELWEHKQGRLVADDMLPIARTQVAREEQLAPTAQRFLLCDTTPLTTLLYAQAMFGHACAELEALAQRPYDEVLLCAPDVPFIQDGTRRDEAFRAWQHRWYLRELAARGVRYRLLTGGWQARTAAAWAILSPAIR